MARTDYGAILSTVIKDTSDSVRLRENTESLFAPSDWSNEIKKMEMMKVATATAGSIVTFNDGVEQAPFVSLKPTITPVQAGSGDPSPSNPRPISGWNGAVVNRCGTNLWDEEWEKNAAYNSQGQKVVWANAIRNMSPIYVSPNTSYYLKFGTTNTVYVYWYDVNMGFISLQTCNSPQVITSPSNARYMNFNTNANYGTTYNNDISINYPSTDTDYHAFVGNPYTQYFEGLLNGTYGFVDLGTLNWVATGDGRFKANISDIKVAPIRTLRLMCTVYQANLGNDPFLDKSIYNGSNEASVIVYDTTYSSGTASAFTDAMDGVYLIYELATPTIPTITQTQMNALVNAFGIDGESAIVVFPHTVYGGELDVVSGSGSEDYGLIVFDGSSDENWQDYSSFNGFYINVSSMKTGTRQAGLCNQLVNSSSSASGQTNAFWLGVNSKNIFLIGVNDSMGATVSDLRTYLANNPLTFAYPLSTPTTLTTSPVAFNARNGQNNVWSDTGDISECKYYTTNAGHGIQDLFEQSDLIANTYIANGGGAETPYIGWSSTDFLAVTAGETLNFATTNMEGYNGWYDSSKTWISAFVPAPSVENAGYFTLTVPSGVSYMRLSQTDNIMAHTRVWRET